MDTVSKKKRSEIMSKIRSQNTSPELKFRKALHNRGFRYLLHDKRLPGKPDIVMPKYKTAIQVRGCFWHSHSCKIGHIPKSNRSFWTSKFKRKKQRDTLNDKLLRKMGWKVVVVWECSLIKNKGCIMCV